MKMWKCENVEVWKYENASSREGTLSHAKFAKVAGIGFPFAKKFAVATIFIFSYLHIGIFPQFHISLAANAATTFCNPMPIPDTPVGILCRDSLNGDAIPEIAWQKDCWTNAACGLKEVRQFPGERTIRSFRVIWRDLGLDTNRGVLPGPYRYRVDYRSNGVWWTWLDASKNDVDLMVDYREAPEAKADAVRLVVLSAPPPASLQGSWSSRSLASDEK